MTSSITHTHTHSYFLWVQFDLFGAHLQNVADAHWFLIFPVPLAFSQCSLLSMFNPTFNFFQPFSGQ